MARLKDQTGRGGSSGLPISNEGRDAFLDDYGNLAQSEEELVSGASAITVSLGPRSTQVVTGGTDAGEDVNLGDGTASVANAAAVVGQRKLVTLKTRSSGSDVVNLDHANIANAAGTDATNCDLDAAGEHFLFEWNGTKWQIIYGTGTIAP